MAYIGRDTDKLSNVEVLDNITFDGSSSYTLQKNSVNFIPSSANTLLVSIDGVVQAGNFTVSGSTIDFGTAVAGTSTCDFILHYGVGLITTPSDGTVTTAKLADSSVTAAKITDSTITAAKLASGTVQNQSAFKNIIINGDMSLAQRSTSVSSITTSGYNTVDRFRLAMSSAGTWTSSQDTDVPSGQGFANSLKLDCTTADASLAASDYVQYNQFVEGQNLQYLKWGTASAESLTLSFWVKSNKTGTYIAELRNSDNTRTRSLSYTISASNTWEKKTITFGGDTNSAPANDNGEGLRLTLWLAAGSNFTSGTLATDWETTTQANRAVGQVNLADSTSNEWYITGIQLEAGTTASDFEFLPHDVNLRRCQRYCFVKADGTGALGIATYYTGSNMRASISFPTTMRAIPTLEIETVTNGYQMNTNGSQDFVDDFTINQANLTEAQLVNSTDASGTGGQAGTLHANVSTCFLAFISEL